MHLYLCVTWQYALLCYRDIVDYLWSRRMETAPTSIEVLLRPTLGQSDEPSDLRGSLSPTTRHRCTHVLWCIQHLVVPGGHPSDYGPGPALLNFSDRADIDELTPYSVYYFLRKEIYQKESKLTLVIIVQGQFLLLSLLELPTYNEIESYKRSENVFYSSNLVSGAFFKLTLGRGGGGGGS